MYYTEYAFILYLMHVIKCLFYLILEQKIHRL